MAPGTAVRGAPSRRCVLVLVELLVQMDAFNGSGDELSGRAVGEVGAPARDLRFPGKVPSIHGEAVLPTKEQADMAADAGRALPTAVAHFQRVDGHRSRRHGSMSWTSTDRCTAARKWASRTCLSPVLTSCRGSFACSGQGRKAQTLEAAGAKRWRRRGRGRGRCWPVGVRESYPP